MKLESKYFDRIRIKPRRAASAKAAQRESTDACLCEWQGCANRGLFRAPKGRDREGEYYVFCRDHVSAYNKSYNYFAGMSDGDIADFQKSAATGHRPTWSMRADQPQTFRAANANASAGMEAQDPLEILRGLRGRNGTGPEPKPSPRRILHKAALSHLSALNLDDTATADEIRAQFKALVKLHHPDHNGGDRSSEERFREVIAAYNYLKQAGVC